MLGNFVKKWDQPNLVKIGQEYLEFYRKSSSTFYCCLRH